jgi:hypothetical protein
VPTTAIGAPVALSPERVARKIKTTAELLEKRGHLSRQLRGALDAYATLVATAMFVGPSEEDASRAREARRRWKALEQQIPEELLDVIEQLVNEETGLVAGRPSRCSGSAASSAQNGMPALKEITQSKDEKKAEWYKRDRQRRSLKQNSSRLGT